MATDTSQLKGLELTPEIVSIAYHILLGRPPESQDVIEAGVDLYKDTQTLRESFASYPETRRALFKLLFDHLPFNSIKVNSKRGFSLYINLSDLGVSSEIFLFDEFEPHNERFLLDNLNPNETFLDIGANIGWFTLIAAQKIARDWDKNKGPIGKVIGFEANINTGKMLAASVQDSPYRENILIYNTALAPELSLLEFEDVKHGNIGGAQVRQISDDTSTPNQTHIQEKYANIHDAFGDCDKRAIPAVSLDSLLAKHNQKIGLVKMDVEGSEPYVLAGATETLARHQPKLLIEFHKDKLEYSSNKTATEMALQLFEMNYQIFDFQGNPAQKLDASDIEKILDHYGYYDFLAYPN